MVLDCPCPRVSSCLVLYLLSRYILSLLRLPRVLSEIPHCFTAGTISRMTMLAPVHTAGGKMAS